MARKITTLYINDTSIRLMVTRGKRISKLADVPLDLNLADVSDKVKKAELSTKIKYLFKTNKVNAKKVIIGLSGLRCLSRPAVLPQLPKALLEEAVIREAKRVLPVPTEQLYISWQIVTAAEGKMQAFMVGIPRQIVDTLLGVLHQVGLKPQLMDIKPLALARLVQEATAILVDVQSAEFDIVIMVDGVPQPVRTVPFPEEMLSIPDKLSIVKDELKRTVEFYNSNNPEEPLQTDVTMYVSGELADEPELYESLASSLGYQVAPLSSPLKCPKQLDPSRYLVNIGLTLKELTKEAGPLLPNLNILPVSYRPRQISLSRLMALPATAIAIGLIALLAMTLQNAAANIDMASSKLDAANVIIVKKQSQNKEYTENIAALEKKLADAEAARQTFTAALDSLESEGDKINGDLEATVYNLVDGVDLKSISHIGKELSISGEAPSEVEVLEYARNLDATGRFTEITITSIRLVGSETEEVEGEGEEVEGEGEEIEGEGEEVEGEGEEIQVEYGEIEGGAENEAVAFNLALRLKGIE